MNWDAIAAIGELAGAVGVIVTLIYVGLQVRQNTSAIKAAAIQDIAASTTAYLNTWSSDTHIPGLLVRVGAGELPDALTAEQNVRLTLTYMSMLRAYEARYLQLRLGVLDESILESMAGSSALFRLPWFRASWNERFAPLVGADFAAFFTRRFEID
jgi:hypothetical protein